MRFVKLNKIQQGNAYEILFNLNHAIEIVPYNGGSRIGMDGDAMFVRETPDEIMAMIGGDDEPNPLEWTRITHPLTWPCVQCGENFEVPSRGFMCPSCVETKLSQEADHA